MSDMLVFEGEITEDGQLIVELPPDVPRGRVTVALLRSSVGDARSQAKNDDEDDDFEFTEEDVIGLGKTVEEILKSPAIGMWADREDMADSAAYVAAMRHRLSQRYKHLWE